MNTKVIYNSGVFWESERSIFHIVDANVLRNKHINLLNLISFFHEKVRWLTLQKQYSVCVCIYMSFADSTVSLYHNSSVWLDFRLLQARIETRPIWYQSKILPLGHRRIARETDGFKICVLMSKIHKNNSLTGQIGLWC